MDIETIKQFIYDYEIENPVEKWNIDGMDMWPILRILVYTESRDILMSKNNNVTKDWKAPKSIKSRNLLSKLLIGVKALTKSILRYCKRYFYKPKKIISGEYILFFGSLYFRTDVQGKFINRFFEPLIQYIENRFSLTPLIVEYSGIPKLMKSKNFGDSTIDLHQYQIKKGKHSNLYNEFWFTSFFELYFNKFDLREFDGIDKVIEKKINTVLSNRPRYHSLFKVYKPRFVICLTFFNEQMFAMVNVARELGITTIDLGHGYTNERTNLVYNHWGNVPVSGYNSLPDIFWVWDDSIKNLMNNWISRQSHHTVLVGGNPWLEYYKSLSTPINLSDKKVILYTMSANFPNPIILELMALTPSNIEWWIRVHPSISKPVADLKAFLENLNLFNFNLLDANSKPLPELLINCALHFSNNSSSIYESIILGNAPIIIDQNGVDDYFDYISKGMAINGLNLGTNELESLLENNGRKKFDLVSTSPKLYQDVIDKLLNLKYNSFN